MYIFFPQKGNMREKKTRISSQPLQPNTQLLSLPCELVKIKTTIIAVMIFASLLCSHYLLWSKVVTYQNNHERKSTPWH